MHTPFTTDPRLVVMALLVAREGREAELREALLRQILKIYQEPGYVQFDLHQSSSNPREFALYEIWESEALLRLHFEQPHTQELVNTLADLLEQPMAVWHLDRLIPAQPSPIHSIFNP